jgi:TrmH family RNA methyltransferase
MNEGVLTSTANPRVKAWLALRDRRGRDRAGLTLVDGIREVGRALDAGATIVELVAGPSSDASPAALRLIDDARVRGIPVAPVGHAVEERVGFGDRAEGIVAVARIPDLQLSALALPPDPLVAVLEGIEKPGNLGAVLRTADGAGVDAVVVADPHTDPYNPNAIRASLGTVFSMPLAVARAAEVLGWCRAQGLGIIAARVDAGTAYTDVDLVGPIAIVVGSEADGLTGVWDEADVVPVRLPMHGTADSLNVSVAAAILLYEARRQRDARRA